MENHFVIYFNFYLFIFLEQCFILRNLGRKLYPYLYKTGFKIRSYIFLPVVIESCADFHLISFSRALSFNENSSPRRFDCKFELFLIVSFKTNRNATINTRFWVIFV